MKIGNDITQLRSCVVYNIAMQRLIKVVLVQQRMGDKICQALLFSTDITLDASKIVEFYVSRFQIEFIFRDAKNFAGLADCQSRAARRLHYHFNASLLALNLIKLQDAAAQQAAQTNHPFSASNFTRESHVQIVINRFISMFGFDQTIIKSDPRFNDLLTLGRIQH